MNQLLLRTINRLAGFTIGFNSLQIAAIYGKLDLDYHAIAEADLAFHRHLLERAGQPDLIIIWETLVGRIRSHFRRTQKLSADAMEIYEEHLALVESFRGRDLAAAVRLLKEKID